MLKNPYYLTFVLLVWLIASLVLRISYNYPNTLYNWLLASLIIRLIVRLFMQHIRKMRRSVG